MVRIELASFTEYMPRVIDLMRENWAETGFDFEFNPAVDLYQSLCDQGVMFALGAFDGDEVVGYCTVGIVPHLHNPQIMCASNDALYVKPAYRGITSARLIRRAEQEAKARGASRMLWHTRAGTAFSTMLERRGYQPADVVVMKEL